MRPPPYPGHKPPSRWIQPLSRTLGLPPQSLRHLLETLAAEARSSRSRQVAVHLTVQLGPDGTLRLVEPWLLMPNKRDGASSQTVPAEACATALPALEWASAVLDEPHMLSAEAFGRRFGLSRTQVQARRRNRQLLGLDGGRRGFRHPTWQMGADDEPFAVLPQLHALLGNSAWAVYRFLAQRHGALGGLTGHEALRRGRDAAVVAAAARFALRVRSPLPSTPPEPRP